MNMSSNYTIDSTHPPNDPLSFLGTYISNMLRGLQSATQLRTTSVPGSCLLSALTSLTAALFSLVFVCLPVQNAVMTHFNLIQMLHGSCNDSVNACPPTHTPWVHVNHSAILVYTETTETEWGFIQLFTPSWWLRKRTSSTSSIKRLYEASWIYLNPVLLRTFLFFLLGKMRQRFPLQLFFYKMSRILLFLKTLLKTEFPPWHRGLRIWLPWLGSNLTSEAQVWSLADTAG